MRDVSLACVGGTLPTARAYPSPVRRSILIVAKVFRTVW